MAIVWQISAIQFNDKTLITGFILKNILWPDYKGIQKLKNIYLVISSYFRKRYKNKRIIISTDTIQTNTQTDKHGKFTIIVNQKEILEVNILDYETKKTFEIIQSYPIIFPDSNNPIAVITDIDDTVLISNTKRVIKAIATVLFVTPHKRVPVDFTVNLLSAFYKKGSRVFYVSKSESNLFAMLTYFIKNRDLPSGHLQLTPYIKFNQLFRTKGGKDYKEIAIRFIIDNSKDKRFILVGDDTQHDMKIYHNIAITYPNKILKIYIHKTRKYLKGSKEDHMNDLNKLPIPIVYFYNNDNFIDELNYVKSL